MRGSSLSNIILWYEKHHAVPSTSPILVLHDDHHADPTRLYPTWLVLLCWHNLRQHYSFTVFIQIDAHVLIDAHPLHHQTFDTQK